MKEESDMAAHRDIRGCVSVVIPAFNEAGNLTHLYERLCSVLEADGWELSLSRNFGHQAALLARPRPIDCGHCIHESLGRIGL
jgi:hypothetical protein